jgi:hypothetical protein
MYHSRIRVTHDSTTLLLVQHLETLKRIAGDHNQRNSASKCEHLHMVTWAGSLIAVWVEDTQRRWKRHNEGGKDPSTLPWLMVAICGVILLTFSITREKFKSSKGPLPSHGMLRNRLTIVHPVAKRHQVDVSFPAAPSHFHFNPAFDVSATTSTPHSSPNTHGVVGSVARGEHVVLLHATCSQSHANTKMPANGARPLQQAAARAIEPHHPRITRKTNPFRLEPALRFDLNNAATSQGQKCAKCHLITGGKVAYVGGVRSTGASISPFFPSAAGTTVAPLWHDQHSSR